MREISFILQSGFDAVVIAGEEISLHLLYSGLLWQWLSEVEILTSKKKKKTRLWKSEAIWLDYKLLGCWWWWWGALRSNLLGGGWWCFASTDVSGTTMKPVCFPSPAHAAATGCDG